MNRFFRSLLLAVICLLLLAPSADASMGVRENGTRRGIFTDLNIIGASVSVNSSESSVADIDIVSADLIAMGIDESGATTFETGLTSIPATYAVVNMVLETKTATLANGSDSGQVMVLRGIAEPDGVSATLTLDATTKTGWTSITFDANGEVVTLLYVDSTTGWVYIGGSGATVTLSNTH